MKPTRTTKTSAPISWIDPGLLAAATPATKRTKSGLLLLDVADLVTDPRNARTHDAANLAAIRKSHERYKQRKSIVVQRRKDGTLKVSAGNGTLKAFIECGWSKIVGLVIEESDESATGFGVVDNRSAELAGWDQEVLATLLREQAEAGISSEELGFSAADAEIIARAIDDSGGRGTDPVPAIGGLLERFGFPPFSVLDARSGRWQERKASWLALGIKSYAGRGANLLGLSEKAQLKKKPGKKLLLPTSSSTDFYRRKRETEKALGRKLETAEFEELYVTDDPKNNGTSIFDPVLCELVYRWFAPPKGVVLDPFAGGSVRGIVASKLGLSYRGTDLSTGQIEANRENLEAIARDTKEPLSGTGWGPTPCWLEADSARTDFAKLFQIKDFDLVFSCPPYGDLERYSDDLRDLSTLPWKAFLRGYRAAIANAAAALKPNRFAVFVVTEIRDRETGNYRGFVPETIRAFEDAGLSLYNEAILVQALASVPLRAGRIFSAGRKLGRCHQNVLVFLKGDATAAHAELGDVPAIDFDLGQTEGDAADGLAGEVDDSDDPFADLGHKLDEKELEP